MNKFYAILIIDYYNKENTELYSNIFLTEKAAHAEVKKLANEYIKLRKKQNRKDQLKFNESAGMVYSGPSINCLFAEVLYKVEEVSILS